MNKITTKSSETTKISLEDMLRSYSSGCIAAKLMQCPKNVESQKLYTDLNDKKSLHLLLSAIYNIDIAGSRENLSRILNNICLNTSRNAISEFTEVYLTHQTYSTIAEEYINTGHNRPSAIDKSNRIIDLYVQTQKKLDDVIEFLNVEYRSNITMLKIGCLDEELCVKIRAKADDIVDYAISLWNLRYDRNSADKKQVELMNELSEYKAKRTTHKHLEQKLDIIELQLAKINDREQKDFKELGRMIRKGILSIGDGVIYSLCKKADYYEGIKRCRRLYIIK